MSSATPNGTPPPTSSARTISSVPTIGTVPLVDEQGRILGVANVVDVMIVTLVLGLGIAGGLLVTGSSTDGGAATHNGTVAYQAPLGSDAAALQAGDRIRPYGRGDVLRVREVHRSFAPNGSVRVVAGVEYGGRLDGAGNRRYAGEDYDVLARDHRVRLDVLAVDRATTDLGTKTVDVVVTVNASRQTGHALEAGTPVRIGDHRVATIEDVRRISEDGATGGELVGLEVTVRRDGGVDRFGGRPVRVNAPLTLVTDDVVLTGRIYAVGTADVDGVS